MRFESYLQQMFYYARETSKFQIGITLTRISLRKTFSYFFHKTRFNVFSLSNFLFLAQLKYTQYLRIISCETVQRKYTELSIHANIYLSIVHIGSVLR